MSQKISKSKTPSVWISKEKKLKNEFFIAYFQAIDLLSSWLVPIVDRKTDHLPEYRNRMFCILVYGLVDAARNYENRLKDIQDRAKSSHNEAIQYYAPTLKFLYDGITDIMSIYSRDEMFYLSERRSQYCHGYLSALHNEQRHVWYVNNRKFVKGEFRSEELNAVIYSWHEENQKQVDDILTDLRMRFCTTRTLFWHAYYFCRRIWCTGQIMKEIDSKNKFNINSASVTWDFDPSNYWKINDSFDSELPNLVEIVASPDFYIGGETEKDAFAISVDAVQGSVRPSLPRLFKTHQGIHFHLNSSRLI